ncbi:MAG: hypothetical protein R3F43_23845 [bacterium]
MEPAAARRPAPPPLAPGAEDAEVLVVAIPHGLTCTRQRRQGRAAAGGARADRRRRGRGAGRGADANRRPRAADFIVRGEEARRRRAGLVPAFPRLDAEAVRNALAAAVERAIRSVWEEATTAGRSAREAALTLALRRLDAAHAG